MGNLREAGLALPLTVDMRVSVEAPRTQIVVELCEYPIDAPHYRDIFVRHQSLKNLVLDMVLVIKVLV